MTDNFVKKSLKTLLLCVPFALLFVSNTMFFPFISGKGIVFRFLIEIAFALYLFLLIKDKTLLPKKGILLILLSVFTLWVFISDMMAPNVTKAFWSNFERMEGFVLIGHLFLYFVILSSVFKSIVDWYKFFYAVLATSIGMSLFAFLQIFGGTVINQGGGRVDALMGNSAYFAGFCLVTFFIGLFLFKDGIQNSRSIAKAFFVGALTFCFIYIFGEKKTSIGNTLSILALGISSGVLWCSFIFKKHTDKILSIILFIVFFCVQTYLIFLTQTRGAALGFLGGLFLTSLLIAIIEKKSIVKTIAICIIATIGIIIGTFLVIKDSQFVKERPMLNRFAEISWKNTSGQARQIIWPMAIEGFKEKPLFGWGQEGFNYVFAKYYNPELWRHESWFDRTHNVFLDWLVATGIVGLLLYLSFYVFALKGMINTFWRDKKIEFSILVGLLSAYAFQNLFIFDNLASYILFFALLAFIHSQMSSNEKELITKSKKHHAEEVHPGLGLVLAIGVLFIFSFYFVYKPLVQNRAIIKGMMPQKNITDNLSYFKKAFSLGGGGVAEAREQFMSVTNQIIGIPQLSTDIKRGFFVELLDQARLQQQQAPEDLKTQLSLATGFNQNGNPDIALEILKNLREKSPKKQSFLMQVGIAYLLKGDLQSAEEILRENFNNSPEYPDGGMLYASVLLDTGKTKDALKILEAFSRKGEMLKPYVIANLKQKGLTQELKRLLALIYEVNPGSNVASVIESLENTK